MSTMKDIAALLGVTPSTVSRALNDKPGVSAEVRAQILAEAARLDIVVNASAQSLRTAQTMTVAMVVAWPQDEDHLAEEPFYGRIMLGVEKELQERGYHLLVTSLTPEHIARPQRWSVLHGRADGLILMGPLIPTPFIRALQKRGVPMVLVDHAVDEPLVDAVLTEDRVGARALARHVVAHGHRRIVILSGSDTWATVQERCGGFLDVLRSSGQEPLAILRADLASETWGYQLMQEALTYRPTAVMAFSDRMAMGAIEAARAAGISVPNDIAVTGFDNIAAAARLNPPLTTIHNPTVDVGRAAARRIVERIASPTFPSQRTLLATSLIVRRSCGCPGTEAQPPNAPIDELESSKQRREE